MRSKNPHRLRYVEEVVSRGVSHLYYRREGRRHPLPGPEGSAAFLSAYDAVHSGVDRSRALSGATVHEAITGYLASADYHSLAPASRRQYRWSLDYFRERAGAVHMVDVNDGWVADLRDAMKADPIRWNGIRSRMSDVFVRWRRASGEQTLQNPWREVRRLHVGDSDQNRPWPDDVLAPVLTAATPEFRALIVTLLLTSQRLADTCRMPPDAYAASARTLTFTQGKTGQRMVIHVPSFLSATFETMAGRRTDRLLVTPRGQAWLPGNAQETLATLRGTLDTGRYTLHGLRATGPVALVGLGFSPEEIIRLTGHTDVAGLRPYLRGVDKHAMAVPLQDALDERFAKVLAAASDGGNARKFSGLTGRAAAKAGKVGRSSRPAAHEEGPDPTANGLPTANRKAG